MPAPPKKVYNASSGLQGSVATGKIFQGSVSVAQGRFFQRRCGKETSTLIVLHCPSRSLPPSGLPLLSPSLSPPKLSSLAFLASYRRLPSSLLPSGLRLLSPSKHCYLPSLLPPELPSLAFAIAARVTCHCLQCRCMRSKSLPTSKPSSLDAGLGFGG